MRGVPHEDKYRRLIAALEEGCGATEAARRSGYNRRHVYRLRDEDPRVARLFAKLPKRKVGGAAARPAASSPPAPAAAPASPPPAALELRAEEASALETLSSIAGDESAPARDRIRAAGLILKWAEKRAPRLLAPEQPAPEPEPEAPQAAPEPTQGRTLSAEEVRARLRLHGR